MNTTTLSSPAVEASTSPTMQPRYDIQRTTEATTVQVALPGVPKELISVSFEKGILSVKGVRRANRPDNWKPVHRELSDVDFSLHLRLTGPVDEDKLAAAYADGVLTLTLPIRESAKPRLIAVN